MKYFNSQFKDKIYMIEFSNGSAKSYFGFSVPPQSEEFTFAQRIGETKTFGGSVFEDYGNDTGHITLSGSTINSEIREIKTKNDSVEKVDGEQEIFKLKELIDSFGEVDKLKDKTITLYALDSSYKSWNVVINEFDIKRSKENPLAYNYTLTCTSYNTYERENENISNKFFDAIQSAIDFLNGKLDQINSWIENYRDGLNILKTCRQKLTELENAIIKYGQIWNGFVDATTEYIQEVKPFTDLLTQSPGRVILNVEKSVFTSAIELNSSIVELVDYIKSFGDSEKKVYQEIIEEWGLSAKEIVEAWKVQADDVQTASNDVVKTVSKSSNQNSLAVNPGNANSSDEVVPIYGYTTKVCSDADSWDGLALKYYNDASYSKMLATYNQTQGIELSAGNSLKIPILDKEKSQNENNLIYATPEKIDNYGNDIKLDEKGNINSLQGDFDFTSGSETLGQAINSRLCSAIDSRIRLTTYGIRTTIGGAAEASSYVYSSIKKTLKEDPRVRSVDEINFSGIGDKLEVRVVYTDINENRQSYGGII